MKLEQLKFGKVIGRGGFSTVNHGKWKGKDVALKRIRLPPGYVHDQDSSYNKEIEVLKYACFCVCLCATNCCAYCRQLDHPNIISLLGYTTSEEESILITNFIDGKNLAQMLLGKWDYKEVRISYYTCMTYTLLYVILLYMHSSQTKKLPILLSR